MARAAGKISSYAKAHPLETVVRFLATAAVLMDIVKLVAKANLALAPGTARSYLTELVVARTALRAQEVVLEIAALRRDTAAARRLIAQLDVTRRSEHVPLAPPRS
jgi:hypothetical protein